MESQGQHHEGKGKRNFNKKKWRETQYSHKERVSEWESKRKEAVKRKYRKMLKKDESTSSVQTTYQLYNAEEGNVNGYSEPPRQRLSEFQRAKLEYERIQGLKEEARLEREQKIKEREIAIMKSKQMRLERIKKLTQKTKKGQPVMKGRIEILLQKIQKQVVNDS
ncbi:hypothetical protein DAPPUDRAFT_221383 [Daphnia pulex]|uniref:rRNA-processing protein FYV7 n=1 Tax=Daphnia pulex TaxID=6669 RepID=E9FXX7_DAPPU|nr:hypothetical protein DAPPUDRAFT_221383 [Daphnia pulex]|eukprot:EFX88179.1 hypothetical protein DAPPUDRAFT_221383 [Daphnia pulex]